MTDERVTTITPIWLGPDATTGGFIEEQDERGAGFNIWDPAEWEKRGWKRNWGDAAVMHPAFEVLRKVDDTSASHYQCQNAQFLILCPTFLRRPLTLYLQVNAWGAF